MARPLFSDVTALVRDLADDVDQGAGIVLPDADLYKMGSRIQRKIFAKLVEKGVSVSSLYITRTVTSADSEINYAVPVGQELPDDFMVPLRLWEKLSTENDSSYVLMSNKSERLPDQDSTETLQWWVWEDDTTAPGLRFIAPTTTRTVRIQYIRQPPAITAASTPLYVGGSVDAMASGLLELAALRRRDRESVDHWGQEFQRDLDSLVRQFTKSEQRRSRRRRSYRYTRDFRT